MNLHVNNIETLLKLFPPLITIIAAIIKYWNSYNKRKYILQQAEEILSVVLVPMIHELRRILYSNNQEKQLELLVSFFNKYDDSNSLLYKLGDSFQLDWYYDLSKSFNVYFTNQSDVDGSKAWKKMVSFYRSLKKYYFDLHFMVYSDLRWHGFISQKNPFFQFLINLGCIFYYLLEFLSGSLLIVFLLLLYGWAVRIPGVTWDYVPISGLILFISLILWGIFMILVSGIIIYKKPSRLNPNGFLSSKFNKLFNSIMSWDKWLDKNYPDERVPNWIKNSKPLKRLDITDESAENVFTEIDKKECIPNLCKVQNNVE